VFTSRMILLVVLGSVVVWAPGQQPGAAASMTREGRSEADSIRSVPTAPGAEVWVARYGTNSSEEIGRVVHLSPDGSRVFVTGVSARDYLTTAYDAATGAELWAARYDGPLQSTDNVHALAVSPNGSRVFVTGVSYGGSTNYDYATVAYDAATGAQVWVRRYNDPGNGIDSAYALAVSPDGSEVFVTGSSEGGSTDVDYVTIAYRAATGRRVALARYNSTENGIDSAYALAVSPNGSRVFVSGRSYRLTSDADYATVAYDASTWNRLWLARYDGPGHDYDAPLGLGVSPDGSQVFVTGQSWGGSTSYDYATLAYDSSTGMEEWAMRYDGPGRDYDAARSLAVSPDGSKVFVTGESSGGSTDADYATVAYAASNGVELWVVRYNGPGNGRDDAAALSASPDGSMIFVTGRSRGSTTRSDYATVAYATPTGSERWVARYDGPGHGHDGATDVDVSPDGSMAFVTGGSHGASTGPDIATIAYLAA
jgi:WD40 repeat protein